MTVRRDLGALARDGKLERVHGGAVDAGTEPGFSQIEVERFDIKDRLGSAAASMVEDGMTVMIDIGTSTLQMARHLHGRKITVVTTNLAVVEELLPDPDIELVLPGGIVRRNYRSLVGVLAEDSLRQIKSDILFLGTSGVDLEIGRVGHHDGRGPDQAPDDRRRRRGRADRRRRQVLDDRHGPRVRAGVDLAHRHRRAPAGIRALGRRRRRDRGHRRMKLTIVGGGGFRVPLVYGALLKKKERLGLEEVVLHDIDAGRLERMGAVLEGLAAERGTQLPFRFTTDLVDAVEGADFVFCAIRVGQLEGRVVDEDVPLGLGVLGQETTGPGGICFALRTIPVMVRLAETMAKHAPNAWLINFTNPAGMVTEAVQQVLGDRAVGICDSPSRAVPARGRGGRSRPRRAVVRLLRSQPSWLVARGARREWDAAARRVARR